MIEQATLFDMPHAPPKPPVIQAAPLGPCIKCGQDAALTSPGGSVYCQKHGYCARRTCLKSVEKFVWHERLKIWCCPCILRFEEKMKEAV